MGLLARMVITLDMFWSYLTSSTDFDSRNDSIDVDEPLCLMTNQLSNVFVNMNAVAILGDEPLTTELSV